MTDRDRPSDVGAPDLHSPYSPREPGEQILHHTRERAPVKVRLGRALWVTLPIAILAGPAPLGAGGGDQRDQEDVLELRGGALERKPLEPVPAAAPPVVGEVPGDILERLRTDLEQRDCSGAQPELVRAESRVWPNGAMGCPRPGMNYTQAFIEGYHVVFACGGRQWDYRTDLGGNFILCDQGVTPGKRPGEPTR